MIVGPVACAVCRDCPVEAVPHYCEYEGRERARAHARWVEFNERFREGLGLARAQEEPSYEAPPTGIGDLAAWGDATARELAGLATHAVDMQAAERAGGIIANMPRDLAEALWRAYVERGDREDQRRADPIAEARAQVGAKRRLPELLGEAERYFMERLRLFGDAVERPLPLVA